MSNDDLHYWPTSDVPEQLQKQSQQRLLVWGEPLPLIRALVEQHDDPECVAGIVTAWDQLSQACHHHAYELVPSQSEISGLVRRLAALSAIADE